MNTLKNTNFKNYKFLIRDKSLLEILPYILLILVFIIKQISSSLSLDLAYNNDSASYILSLDEIKTYFFTHHRTMILPLIYNFFEIAGISLKFWPYFQFFLLIASLHIFYKTIKSKFSKEIISILMSFFYLLLLFIDFRFFTPDVLGLSFLFFSITFAFRLLEKFSIVNIFIFSFSVILTWYIRPAFITIIVPFLVFFFFRLLFYRERVNSFVIICLTILPLISFLGVRYHYTNQIGIVPFIGFTISTHTGYYLNPEIIKNLQPENQTLANKILSRYDRISSDKKLASKWYFYCFKNKENFKLGIRTSSEKKLECFNLWAMTAWISTILHLNETAEYDSSALQIISLNNNFFPLLETELSEFWPKDNVRYDIAMTRLGIDIMKNHLKDHFIYFLYGNYKFIINFFNSFLFIVTVIASFILLPFIRTHYHTEEIRALIYTTLKYSSMFLIFSLFNSLFINFMFGPHDSLYTIFSLVPSIPFVIMLMYFYLLLYKNYINEKLNKFEQNNPNQ